ncbi:unnamed protein product [Caenorhabditis bovis]|uniref:26S proteasome non-ATPase regulatory subunit 4 n=1 Tax=Caenorhabditis bovis TaxID=2654633 RepID=A0A8S1FAL9_9PELO|nr:unnamed protein product [Caenorhabditis bovis]
MVQESTMICVDNSEFMRNGDFQPTRLQSQQDAVNLIMQCKLRANPENAVGILSMADNVNVLSSLSTEAGRLLMKTHQIEPKGTCNFVAGIKVAHLALKHRQNRNHKMRIVIFIGSPLVDIDSAEIVKIAKKLKKEKVQCDVIMFGDADESCQQAFSQFVETLNGKEGSGSNLVVVPTGSALSDALLTSTVCRTDDGGNGGGLGAGGFEFGVDPENDPDLALALRVSMEEERARQAAVAAANNEGGEAAVQNAPIQDASQIPFEEMDMGAMTEEQQLEWAMRLSMQDNAPPASAPAADPANTAHNTSDDDKMEVDVTGNNTPDNLDELMNNPELLQQLVDDLPASQKQDEKKKKEDEKK